METLLKILACIFAVSWLLNEHDEYLDRKADEHKQAVKKWKDSNGR